MPLPQLPDELQAVARMAASTGDLVTVITDELNTIFLSEAGAKFLGLDPQADVGKPLALPVHPDDRPLMLSTREARLRSGDPLELRLKRADGAWRWVELRSFALVAGGQRCIVTSIRDVQARREVEERFRSRTQALETQADASRDGVLVVDAAGRIVSWNRQLATLLEIPEELLQRGVVAEVTQALHDRLVDPEAYLKAAAAPADQATQMLRLELRSGRVLERTRIVPGLKAGGQPANVVLLYRDVTAQVRAELELQRRAAQQAAVSRLSQLALVSPEPRRFFDEAVRLASAAVGFDACILSSYKPGQPNATVLASLGTVGGAGFGAPLPLGAIGLTTAVLHQGQAAVVDDWTTEQRFVYPGTFGPQGLRTGAAVPLFRGSEVAGALAGHRRSPQPFDGQDVAFLQSLANAVAAFLGLQASFEALRRSRESFRALIEEAPDLVLVHRGGTIVYGNAVARQLTGAKSVAELAGRALSSLAHPEERAGLERRIAPPAAPEGRGPPLAVRLLTPEGGERVHELVSLSAAFDGEPAIISFGRDLTERHELQLRLQLADRMASVGTLAAGVAHELNNPLAYVVANLQFLGDELRGFGPVLEQTPVAPRLRHAEESLREAYEGATRLRVIVRDLSTLSRGEGEARGPVDLRPVIASSLNMAQNQIRHRALVVKDLQPVPNVLGNAARLGQVALNLLVNAAQAIPEGNVEGNRIEVRTRFEGGQVIFEVKDSGAGIPQGLLGRIFDPFFTTKEPGIGTGLGLSLCHTIITSMGGRIEVESAPGAGTTFRVLLPPTEALAAAPKLEVPPGAARGKLLVVDDEPLVGLALKRALSREHDVTVLQSGRAALERLRAGEQFDAVVSDLLMPDCTGMELYEALLLLNPKLAERTVFLTGGAFTEGARDFLARPGIRSLEKPFDVDRLRATVRELVAAKGG